jgi:hypothetical protein
MVLRLSWKIWVLVVLFLVVGNILGSWVFEKALAPESRLIRETCPLGLSGDELRGIQGMMPLLWKS